MGKSKGRSWGERPCEGPTGLWKVLRVEWCVLDHWSLREEVKKNVLEMNVKVNFPSTI